MEDIEDLLAGATTGTPLGFHIPLNSVRFNPKKTKTRIFLADDAYNNGLDSKIPGTQDIKLQSPHPEMAPSSFGDPNQTYLTYSLSENYYNPVFQ